MRVGYSVFNWDPKLMAPSFAGFFKDSSYYWMMPFGEDANFATEAANLLAGKPESASDPALDKMITDLMSVAK